MKNERITVRATIDFTFETDPELTISEMIEEFEDRIRMGEYFPRDVIRLVIETPQIENK